MPLRHDGYIPPCIPTRAYQVPSGAGWVHEIKHDGYRLQVRRTGDQVRLFTRRGYLPPCPTPLGPRPKPPIAQPGGFLFL
jgi:hypothetical protein